MKKKTFKSTLPEIKEIEISTMEIWLRLGTITEIDRGCENLYFADEFGLQFYCKCYPR